MDNRRMNAMINTSACSVRIGKFEWPCETVHGEFMEKMFINIISVVCYADPKRCCITWYLSTFTIKNVFVSPWNKNNISIILLLHFVNVTVGN